MQAPSTLENEVGRSQVGNQQVEVEIEALLDDLRGYEDRAVGAARESGLWRAETPAHTLLAGLSLLEREPGMKQIELRLAVRGNAAKMSPQSDINVLRAPHRVADNGGAASIGECGAQAPP